MVIFPKVKTVALMIFTTDSISSKLKHLNIKNFEHMEVLFCPPPPGSTLLINEIMKKEQRLS